MSEDLTKKLPTSDSEKLTSILTTLQALEGRIQRLEQKVGRLEQKVDGLGQKVDGLERKVDGLERKVDGLEQKVDGLEQKVDERLYDTRPIWEKVIADIAQLQEGQARLHEDVRKIGTSQRDALRRMSVFHDTLISMQADYRDIYDRVRGLETNPNHPNSST